MNKLHVYLSMRSNLYHRLHIYPYISQINLSALVIFTITAALSVSLNYTKILGPLAPRVIQVASIHASLPDDPSLYTGENRDLVVGFSNKELNTVGASVTSKSDRVANAKDYQLSINLLSDGLDIPAERTLGKLDSSSARQLVSKDTSPIPMREGNWSIDVVNAQDSPATSTQLPSNTVTADKVISSDNTVIYHITDQITAKYVMEPRKIKEYITIKDKDAFRSQTSNLKTISQIYKVILPQLLLCHPRT